MSETSEVSERQVEHVVVLGASGTMGYGSGALFAQAAPRVTFLARTKEKAEAGLAAAIRQVNSPAIAERITTASYEELPRALGDADLIFEALSEDLELKREFFERVDAARRPDSIVATVTSGLSINRLAEGRSEAFRRHFLGLHLFNPPHVIVGTELICGAETDPGLARFVQRYAEQRLGRRVILAEDTPGFAGNRVGFRVMNEVAQLAEEYGPALMDQLIGPYTGRALAPLATIDWVGWDVHRAIVNNIYQLTNDEAHERLALPPRMAALIERGTLGNKGGGGFFRRTKDKEKLVIDLETGEYHPLASVKLPDLSFIDEQIALIRAGRHQEALAVFAKAPGELARLARRVIAGYIGYAFSRVGDCAPRIEDIDLIMGTGFNWAPPSALVDLLGLEVTKELLAEAGVPLPPLLASAEPGRRLFSHVDLDLARFFVVR
ncbi:MAG: 3-hydroxyacyl-CoA dehydrogenase family protein [Polyangiaceae bacterium]|nr:3-hydroxyacyl-CoA dehydrogenase family protein [Polyangiaceae bacterium]